MFLAPSSNPTVGYVGGFVNFGAQAPVFKFSADLRHCIYTGITLAGKASKSSVRVVQSANKKGGNARGAVVMYTVTMANSNGLQKRNKADPAEPKPKRHVNKTAIAEATAFTPAGLVVTLPAGTSFVRARVSPAPTVRGAKRNQTLAEPVYDAEANTVTWLDVPLAMRKKRKYVVTAWVLPTATSPLVFQAAAPNCRDLPMTQSYVAVSRLYIYLYVVLMLVIAYPGFEPDDLCIILHHTRSQSSERITAPASSPFYMCKRGGRARPDGASNVFIARTILGLCICPCLFCLFVEAALVFVSCRVVFMCSLLL